MNHLLSLHIHSCFASVSSSDKWVSRVLTPTELNASYTERKEEGFRTILRQIPEDAQDAVAAISLANKWFPITEIAVYGDWTVYYTADREFYYRGLHTRVLQSYDITAKVASYVTTGWSEAEPAAYTVVKEAHDKAENVRATAERVAANYVFPDCDTRLTVPAMRGGLSDELFNQVALQEYILPREDGKVCAFGYIGNSNRRVMLDRFLEDYMRGLGWTLHDIALWLTSTEGRHMAASYETEEDCINHDFTNYAERERLTGKSQSVSRFT